jgi:hypothetical protein
MQRNIFGPKIQDTESKGRLEKFYKGKLHNIFYSLDVIRLRREMNTKFL